MDNLETVKKLANLKLDEIYDSDMDRLEAIIAAFECGLNVAKAAVHMRILEDTPDLKKANPEFYKIAINSVYGLTSVTE